MSKVDYSKYPQGERYGGVFMNNVSHEHGGDAPATVSRLGPHATAYDTLAWMRSQGVSPETFNYPALGTEPGDPRSHTYEGYNHSPLMTEWARTDPQHGWGDHSAVLPQQWAIDHAYQPPASFLPHASVTATSGGANQPQHPLVAAYYMPHAVQAAVAARGITPQTQEPGVRDPYYLAALQEFARQQPQQPLTRGGRAS